MKEFILKDTNRFYLQGTNNRLLHLATLNKGLRTFLCFIDKETNKVYIEELLVGQLYFIEDDSLVEAITNFLSESGVIQMSNPTLPDSIWRPTNKSKKFYI